MPGNGERLSPRKTYEEAETLLNAAMLELAEGRMVEPGTETLRGFGLDFLDDRESAGVADVGTDRSRWKQHIEAAHFIDWPLGSVAPHDVREWLSSVSRKSVARGFRHKKASRRKLSRTTVQNTLNLLRCCFTAAVEADHIETNPAREVAVPDGPGRTHEPWTYLEPKEQEALLDCESIPEAVRLLIAFAVGTGMRQGEIWNLETRDVCMSENRVIVRYGSLDEGQADSVRAALWHRS
jgi:integrase